MHHLNPQHNSAQNYHHHIFENYRNIANNQAKNQPENHSNHREKIHPKRNRLSVARFDGFYCLWQIANHGKESGKRSDYVWSGHIN